MNERSHGYDVSVGYSYSFFREMAPDWLDFCARAAGFEPARRERSFRYLDLGTGQGFGLCLLAATHPDAEFIGVDFHPEHVAHAQSLAAAGGLTNVRFVEADFADLAKAWPADLGTFDYVALQGILSWISPTLREAVVNCVAHATRPGSLVYLGYNAQPGWLGTLPFQHVSHLIKQTTGKSGTDAIQESIGIFERLREANAPIFELLPGLKARLQAVQSQPASYLIHEYLTDSWVLLWHSEVAHELKRADLHYVGSATVAELMLPDVLPRAFRSLIEEQGRTDLRQDLQDLVLNQAFRRDIFCRSARRSGRDTIGETPLHLLTPPEIGRPVKFETSFGEIVMEYSALADIVAAVSGGPKPINELVALPSPTSRETERILLLMLQANMLGIGTADPAPVELAQRLNGAIARAASEGVPYRHVASAALGSGVPVSDLDLLLIDSWLESPDATNVSAIANGVAQRLTRLGRQLHHGGKLVSVEQANAQLEVLATTFIKEVLPQWRALGVLE